MSKRVRPEDRKKMGRPTDYKPEYAEQAFKLMLLTANDDDLADFFGVTQKTINNWKQMFPDFLQALKDGKTKADAEVADSLRNRAKGYEWDEVQPIKVKTVHYENGRRVSEVEEIKEVTVHRVVPPDTAAAFIWLKNRRRDIWRDRHEVDNTGEITHKWEEATDDELDRAIKARQDSLPGATGGA